MSITINPTSLDFSSDGGLNYVSVGTEFADEIWQVQSSPSWLKVNPEAAEGSRLVEITVDPNTSTSSRSEYITFLSFNDGYIARLSITQQGGGIAKPTIYIDRTSYTHNTPDSGTILSAFAVAASEAWAANIIPSGNITISKLTGLAIDAVDINILTNNTTTSDIITIIRCYIVSDPTIYADFTLIQSASYVRVSNSSLNFSSYIGNRDITLDYNGNNSPYATIVSGADFITESGVVRNRIISVTQNTTGVARTGIVRYTSYYTDAIYTDVAIMQSSTGEDIIDIGDISISVPRLGYAFNSININCRTPNNETITAYIPDQNIAITRTGYGGQLTFDLSGVARLLFNRNEFHDIQVIDTILKKTMNISLSTQGVHIANSYIDIIWGAKQIGGIGDKDYTELVYFPDYPFTIPYLATTGEQVSVNDGITTSCGATYTREGNNVYMYTNDEPNVAKCVATFAQEDNHLILYTEAEYAGATFSIESNRLIATEIPGSKILGNANKYNIPITVDKDTTILIMEGSLTTKIKLTVGCNGGNTVYLRWIDSQGRWFYYLFRKQNETLKSSASDIIFEQFFNTINFVDGHHNGSGQYISKSGERTLNITAVHVDQNIYNYVESITTSPIVDMYANGNWLRVKISDVDLTKSNRVLQNLSISIELPELLNQSL